MGYLIPSVTQVDTDPVVIQITTQPHIPVMPNRAGSVVSAAFGSLASLGSGLLDGAIGAIAALDQEASSSSLPSVGAPNADTSISAAATAPDYMPQQGGLSASVGMSYAEDAYASTLIDTLGSYLLNGLTVGSAGLSASTEAAMQDSGLEAELLLKQDEFDKAASEWAERGMDLPDGELAFNVAQIEAAYQDKQIEKSKKILAESQKIAVEHTRLIIEETKKTEKALMDYFSRREDRKVEKAAALVKASAQVANALIRYYSALSDVDKHNASMYSAYARALGSISISTANLQAALMGANADFSAANATVQGAQAELALQTSLLSGMIAGAQAQAQAALAGGAMSAIHVEARMLSSEHISEGTVPAVANAAVY